MKTTIYTLTNERTLEGTAAKVECFLRSCSMKVQKLELKNDTYIIQGRAIDGNFWQIFGSDLAITVRLALRSQNTFTVEVGNGKWLDKIGGTVLGCLIAWPILILTAQGAYDQLKLPERIHGCIQNYLYEEK